MSTDSPATAAGAAQQKRVDAREYIGQLRVFYTHVWVFAIGMVIIFAVNLWVNLTAGLTGYWWAWWSGWALIGWGMGIGIHALVVRVNRPESLGSAWEHRKMNDLLSPERA